MKRAKALILDLHSTSQLCDELSRMLQSSRLLRRLRIKSIELCNSTHLVSKVHDLISKFMPDIVFLVLSSNHLKLAVELVKDLRRQKTPSPLVAVLEKGKSDETLKLIEAGIDDFIAPPIKRTDAIPRVWRLLAPEDKFQKIYKTAKRRLGLQQILGGSPAILSVTKKISLVAKCDVTVLISGETGTGKELCARAIHYLSMRAGKPFIPVDCGAIPVDLVENELFGHIRGAFTGANELKLGLISSADGGTIFLDDIDCLPVSAQVKLLRLLQEKEYRQLGSAKMQRANVRIIAATNRNLEEAVREGKFRQDLYYRLNIIPLPMPTLRDRKEDLPILASHFLEKYAAEFKKRVSSFTPGAMQKLAMYEWPGNVRELEHVIERTVVLSEASLIRKSEIALPMTKTSSVQESFKNAKARVIAQFERSYIQGLLVAHQGNITHAAREAQKNRRAFWQLIRKHRINVQSFRP